MEITGKRGPEGVVKAVCTSEKKVLKTFCSGRTFLERFWYRGRCTRW